MFAGARLSRAFALAAALALLLTLVMLGLDRPLRTEAAPHGIVSFELAGDLESAQAMIAEWGDSGRLVAAFALGLDYLFLIAYAAALALGALFVAQRWPRWGALGRGLAWGMGAAAFFDAVENYALLRLLLGDLDPLWPRLALAMAAPKFALVLAALVFVLLGLGRVALDRR